MDFKNYGCYFIQHKENITVFIYYKTDYIQKYKNHEPNKIWGVFFDKNGRDYVADKDRTYEEMELTLVSMADHIYQYEDFTAEQLFQKIGNPIYTLVWFKNAYRFIESQLNIKDPINIKG
jgi:hypothetical protein